MWISTEAQCVVLVFKLAKQKKNPIFTKVSW